MVLCMPQNTLKVGQKEGALGNGSLRSTQVNCARCRQLRRPDLRGQCSRCLNKEIHCDHLGTVTASSPFVLLIFLSPYFYLLYIFLTFCLFIVFVLFLQCLFNKDQLRALFLQLQG